MASVWGCILKQFFKAMTKLQAEHVDISTAVEIYDFLVIFLTELQICFSNHKDSAEKKLGN